MEPRTPLVAWQTFFFLVGSSAAALTGLQFVVIALVAESKRRATNREIEALTTPTIVHFGAVLLVAAIVSAPWSGIFNPAVVLGACGLAGVTYTFIVIKRSRRLSTYRLVWQDWLCHVVLPLIAYSLLLVSVFLLPGHAHRVLFLIGATALLLLFIGIHNAWDTVTYISVERAHAPEEPEERVDDSLPRRAGAVSGSNQAPAAQKSRRRFRGKK